MEEESATSIMKYIIISTDLASEIYLVRNDNVNDY